MAEDEKAKAAKKPAAKKAAKKAATKRAAAKKATAKRAPVKKTSPKKAPTKKAAKKGAVSGYGGGSVDVVMSVDQVAKEAASIAANAPTVAELDAMITGDDLPVDQQSARRLWQDGNPA